VIGEGAARWERLLRPVERKIVSPTHVVSALPCSWMKAQDAEGHPPCWVCHSQMATFALKNGSSWRDGLHLAGEQKKRAATRMTYIAMCRIRHVVRRPYCARNTARRSSICSPKPPGNQKTLRASLLEDLCRLFTRFTIKEWMRA
jgi:hypothetical protein